MADFNFQPPSPGGWIDIIGGAIMTKVAPALAGSYVRGLFPPRKPIWQRILESIGGVFLVVYAGKPVAGALWAAMDKAMRIAELGRAGDIMDKSEESLLAAFLVGLLGMTIVEGAIVWTRAWVRRRAAEG